MICACGTEFNAAQWQIKSGRAKYCSNPCKYKYRVRPTGLKYEIQQENRAWVKPGERLSPETEFQPGIRNNPDGEIKSGMRISPDTEFKKGHIPVNYKGDQVGYDALHAWVVRHKGKASDLLCSCGEQASDWANISHKYKRDLEDFQPMCKKCHKAYDKGKPGKKDRFL